MPSLPQIKPAAFGQHQGLGRGFQVDEGQHIGDDLDDRRRPKRTHMENPVAHRLHRAVVQIKKILVTARQHGDLALIGQMHPARHRQFQHPHPSLGGHSGQAQHLITAERRHLDPGRALLHARQDVAQHALRHCRRRQAGDDVIDRPRQILSAGRQCRPHGHQRLGQFGVQVIDRHLEARFHQAARAGRAQIAKADISVMHVVSLPAARVSYLAV